MITVNLRQFSIAASCENPIVEELRKSQFHLTNEVESDSIYFDLMRDVSLNGVSYQGKSVETVRSALSQLLLPIQIAHLKKSYTQSLSSVFLNIMMAGLTPLGMHERDRALFVVNGRESQRKLNITIEQRQVRAVLTGQSPVFNLFDDPEGHAFRLDVNYQLEFHLSDKRFKWETLTIWGAHEAIAKKLIEQTFSWTNAEDVNAVGSQFKDVLTIFIDIVRKKLNALSQEIECEILESVTLFMPDQPTQSFLTSFHVLLNEEPTNWLSPAFIDACDPSIKGAIIHASLSYAQKKRRIEGPLSRVQWYDPIPGILKALQQNLKSHPELLDELTGTQIRDLHSSHFNVTDNELLVKCFPVSLQQWVVLSHVNHVKENYQKPLYALAKGLFKRANQQPFAPVKEIMDEFAKLLSSPQSSEKDVSKRLLEINTIAVHPHQSYLSSDYRDEFRGYEPDIQCCIYRAECTSLLESMRRELEAHQMVRSQQASLKQEKIQVLENLIQYVDAYHRLPAKPYVYALKAQYPKEVFEAGAQSARVATLIKQTEQLGARDGPDALPEIPVTPDHHGAAAAL